MDQQIFQQEEAHLNRVLQYIRSSLQGEEGEEQLRRQGIIDERRRIWDDYSRSNRDMQELIQANETLTLDIQQYLRQKDKLSFLHRVLSSPYFARIDFRERGYETVEPLYIGSLSLIEKETSDVLVCDWRADVSSLFYDATVGPCRYRSPMGYVEGEILLRRQLKVENSRLKYFFDTDTTITDHVLQDELGTSSDAKMKTIVSTIQKEQNQVIRNASADLLLVQGSAGSGKTSVALHRLAWLLYKYRKTLRSGDVLIFSPSKIFSAYIEDVLPELGEERAVQEDFFDYFSGFSDTLTFYGKQHQQERLMAAKPGLVEGICRKGSKEFARKLEAFFQANYSEYLHLGGILAFGHTVCSEGKLKELYYETYAAYPPQVRAGKIQSRILDSIEENYKPAQMYLYKKEITQNGIISLQDEELEEECEQRWQEALSRLTEEIRGTLQLDCVALYCDFLRREYPDLAPETISLLEENTVYYEDLFPLAWLRLLSGALPLNHRVQQVVVDEAQEYSPLQYMILSALFKSAKFTILGDPAQSGIDYFSSIQEIGALFPEKKSVASVVLEKTYRSTAEINAFLRRLHKNEGLLCVDRHGKEPEIRQTDDLSGTIISTLEEYQKDGIRTNMIVCRTQEECQRLYDDLKGKISVYLVGENEILGRAQTMILPACLCKGLEADGVIIADASPAWDSNGNGNLLYVACSRALHRLTLLYQAEKSRQI